jgi:hypothetical protein
MAFFARGFRVGFGVVLGGFCILLLDYTTAASAQSTYTAQLSGVVSDSSGAVIPGAKVILTDEGTRVGTTSVTDARGIYVFTGVRPSTYTIHVEAAGLASQEHKALALAVSQEATLNFTLTPGTVSETVSVTTQAPLLDTGNAALGTDVTNEYSYPSGTNFVSNGQRNATAEVRLDGALTSAPEQGEGGTTNVYYQPSVEIVQEFKVENNSFSAEYGNNGGTVVNMVLKQGGNDFHGSGWWFGQRSALDANDFFNNAAGVPRPDHLRDQYGFSLGGPIRKQKTFFFIDLEFTREHDPVNITGTVPTAAERTGDFSQTMTADANGNPVVQAIYNPFQCVAQNGTCLRPQFQGNVIPQQDINPIGQALLNLYPLPNTSGDQFGLDNFRTSTLTNAPSHQFDVKIDHYFNDKQRVAVRYSQSYGEYNVPFVLANSNFNDGFTSSTTVHNIGLEHSWTFTPSAVWTNRFAVDRVSAPVNSAFPNLQSVGFPSSLAANGLNRMPSIQLDGTNNWLSMFTQCCTDTSFAHTLYSYSSSISWVKHAHTIKVGFEQRQFFNNFWQPNYPTGNFYFPQNVTASTPITTDTTQGNSFASLLLGYGAASGPQGSSFINVQPTVADKSWETAFYIQDDWKVNSRLTINLGLRYEWSSPYTERFNHQQFSDFTGNTGVTVDLPNALNPSDLIPTELKGTTLFPLQGGLGRSVPTDRNNVAPRVGFAWSFTPTTVVRGGAGVYYGLSPATNFQYPGTAFSATDPILFSTNNYVTQYATLENPFPAGISQPQREKYGALAMWGYDNSNNLGTEQARNGDIYQWNLGVQHLFPWEITLGVDYSANRSTHLPWGGYSSTRNRNFVSSSLLAQISAQQHALDPNCDADSCVSNYLSTLVPDPFAQFFVGPNAIFNEPASLYAQTDPVTGNPLPIPLSNLLNPYPQFPGTFQGLPNFGANSWYNSLQIRFQKRMNHYVSFEGNYTRSKSEDDSSIGFNAFVGNLNTVYGYTVGNPQQLDRLKNEWAISANDVPNRFVLATIVELPVGRGRWIGRDMNRFVDGVVGGWQISGVITLQSGQPLPIVMAVPRLDDGNQRPNILCNQLSSGLSYHQAAAAALNGSANSSLFNAACFGDPGDQVPGNAPRYFSNLRGDGIRNVDLSFTKEFTIKEQKTLQLRAEFFNFTNTERFAFPDVGVGSATFGEVTSSASGFTPRVMQFGMRFQF